MSNYTDVVQSTTSNLLAKRVGELQQSEGYRAPTPNGIQLYSTLDAALASVQDRLNDTSTTPLTATTSTSPRRPRAGTLPSTFHLSPADSGSSTSRHLAGAGGGILGTPAANTTLSLPASGATTPVSDFSFSSSLLPPPQAINSASSPASSPSVASSSHSSRIRSGSLTLPISGLANAFGPNVFSSTGWTPQDQQLLTPSGAIGQRTNGDGHGESNVNGSRDEVRSPGSTSSYAEDSQRTLDFLGLDGDSGGDGLALSPGVNTRMNGTPRVAASRMQRLGSAGQLTSSTQLQPPSQQPSAFSNQQQTRLRSNTVAAFTRTPSGNQYNGGALPASSSSFLANPISSTVSASSQAPAQTAQVTIDDYDGSSSSYHRSNDSNDSTRLLFSTTAQDEPALAPESGSGSTLDVLGAPPAVGLSLSPSRTRSATIGIGILDDPKEVFMRRRAGTATGMTRHAVQMATNSDTTGIGPVGVGAEYTNGNGTSGLGRSMRGLSLSQDDAATWSNNALRPITPDGADSLSSAYQQPTRSLWIGNLDPKTTSAELQNVFAVYGAIESLRLIPEKECGFVNFVSVENAMRAKEDVITRLAGRLSKNSSSMVRIGYGKDAQLAAPASSLAQMRTTAGPVLGSAAAVPTPAEISLQSAPTRALWVGSIPSNTTPNLLLSIFSPFGPIESARVLTHKSCGFINFERLEDAITARKALNGREILGAEVGSVRIGFAKVPSKIVPNPLDDFTVPPQYVPILPAGYAGAPVDSGTSAGALQDYRSSLFVNVAAASTPTFAGPAVGLAQPQPQPGPLVNGPSVSSGPSPVPEPAETVTADIDEWKMLMRELSGDGPDAEEHIAAVQQPRKPTTYYSSIPLGVLNDPRLSRRYTSADAPRLRDIRKRLDGPTTPDEVDALAYELLEECVGLSSDYIGNTIIQKLFEKATLQARLALLERLAPHMAAIGTHKNGTWAVQRAIQCVHEPEEFAIIEQNLAPYTPPLLLNDFGNYVVQGALRFGSPTNDFIFDAMVDRCWEIGSGRFGARSTRQTLESPQASVFNIKRVAIAILLNSIPLATSSNGTLLVIWLLDSSDLLGRFRLLAARFAPHLVHLCTHKLASAAVIKIVNQRLDTSASQMLLDAIFAEGSKTLQDILIDQIHGTACIAKILNSSCIDQAQRDKLAERTRSVLLSLKVSANPAYRKLHEDLGMPYSGIMPAPPMMQQQQQQYQQQHLHAQPPWLVQGSTGPYTPQYAVPYSYPPAYGMPYGGGPPLVYTQTPLFERQIAHVPPHPSGPYFGKPAFAQPASSPTLSSAGGGANFIGDFHPFSPLGSPRTPYKSLSGDQHF